MARLHVLWMALAMNTLIPPQVWGTGGETPVTLKFVARGPQQPFIEDEAGKHELSFTGHVFMIISLKTSSGSKEEMYGFAPGTDGFGLIKGPGMLRNEWHCGPNDDCDPAKNHELKRLSESDESAAVSISLEEHQRLLKQMVTWNSKKYDLVNQNCMTFINDVAASLGYPPVKWYEGWYPTKMIRALKENIEIEDARRKRIAEDERAAADARQAVRELRAERESLEKEREAAAATSKRRDPNPPTQPAPAPPVSPIPAGWIVCECVNAHAWAGVSNSKWIGGTYYHSDSFPPCP